jgi:hypothetical protein
MGIRESEVKQPREIIPKGLDFSGADRLRDGDALKLSASSVVITDDVGTDVTDAMLVPGSLAISNTTSIFAMIRGGTSGKTYKISFLVGTNFGELMEEDIILPVEDL